nr:LL-diaminopimelate aminotransferase [Pueribacillus theae]
MYTSALMTKFKTSVFSEMAQYKKKKIAEGKEIIDLSIGSPDLPPPTFMMDELARSVCDETQYGYTLTGTDEFLSAVSFFYRNRYNVELDKETEILQLSGSQDGLVHLPLILTDPGDVVLMPDPCYPAYQIGIDLARAEAYRMPLKKENNFFPNLNEIPETVVKKAKLMFLNYPGNPVPVMPTKEFFEEVVAFARKHSIVVVHDFAYSELNFTNEKPISFLSVDGAKEIGVEFNSLSKSFNMAGCRIAYLAGNHHIIKALGRLKSNLDYGVFMPIQKAATKALMEGAQFLDKNRYIYKARRDVLVDGLNEIGWKIDTPDATMFIWAPIPSGFTSLKFTYELIDRAGVVVTPGNAFGEYGEGYVRIALVQHEGKLKKAVEKIKKSNIL